MVADLVAACTASIGANAIVAATIAAIAGCAKLCGIFITGLAAIGSEKTLGRIQ